MALASFWVCKFEYVFAAWRLNLKLNFKRGELAARYLSQNSLKLTTINDGADVNLKTRE